jgi:hypothetical protein
MTRVLSQNGWDVNVVNMGKSDAGPDQHLRLLTQYLLPRLKPDVVIWQFYANDIDDNYRRSVYGIESDTLTPLDASEHWIYIRQKLCSFIPLPRFIKKRSRVLRLLLKPLEIWGDNLVTAVTYAEKRAWSKAKIRLEIEELERLARSQRFETYYVLIAPQSMYLMNTDPEHWATVSYAELHELLGDRPDFISAWFTDIQARSHGSDLGDLQASVEADSGIFADEERDPNPLGDRHFNETGYRLLGEAVSRRLLDDRHRSLQRRRPLP